MPSFLNKIINLGRKKEADNGDLKPAKHASTEMRAGTSAPSPTSPKFLDDHPHTYADSTGASRTLGTRSKHKSEDALRNMAQLWKSTSPPTSPRSPTISEAPQLDLTLAISSSVLHSDGKEGEYTVQEKNDAPDEFGTLLLVPDRDHFTMLSDEDVATKLLTPKDVIRLVQAASAVIHAQGLETLGVFHPHWLSTSRSSQRELISRYIATLSPESSTTSQNSFRSALEQAQPTDVADVLKWALRHMTIEQGTFGNAEASTAISDGWGWYVKFAEAERMSSFPTDAFSERLLPLIPPSHVNLLKELLDLLSSVAAHAQGNGMFNTKLCKVFAWWVVCSRKWGAQDESKDTWTDFYDAWDRSSRILEHVMLAYLRDQSRDARGLPVRLIELHTPYPPLSAALASYTPASNSFPLPPRPRLTTQTHGALLVRLESPYGVKPRQPRDNPIRLLEEALAARPAYISAFSYEPIANSYHALWSEIRADVAKQRARVASPSPAADIISLNAINLDDGGILSADISTTQTSTPVLSILSDTTVRWLNLIAPPKDKDTTPEPITPTIEVSTFADSTIPHIPPSQMFRREGGFSLNDSPRAFAGPSLAVLHENESGQQAMPTDSPQDHRLSMASSMMTINGVGTGIGELGYLHEMMSSISLASFVPEGDEYLKTFSTAGFLSPSEESGLGALGGDTSGLAQTLVRPAALERTSKTGSGSTSSSGGQGGPGQGGKNERRSFTSPPIKRKTTTTSVTSALSRRVAGGSRQSTDIHQSGTSTPSNSTRVPHFATDGIPEDVTVLAVPPTRIELDEAFVDTWADTLLDEQAVSVPQAWPNFALFQLKSPRTAGVLNGGEPIEWLVIEQHVCTTPPPPPASPAPPESQGEVGGESRADKRGKKMKRSTSPSGLSVRSAGTSRFGAGAGARARNRLSRFFGFSSGTKEDLEAPPSPPFNPPSSQTVTPAPGEPGTSVSREDDTHFDLRNISPPPPPDSADPVPFPRTGGSSLVDENEDPEPISEQEVEAVMAKSNLAEPEDDTASKPVSGPLVASTPLQEPSTARAEQRGAEPAGRSSLLAEHTATRVLSRELAPARKPDPVPEPALEPTPEPVPALGLGVSVAAVIHASPAAVIPEEPKAARNTERKMTDPTDIPIPPSLSDISD